MFGQEPAHLDRPSCRVADEVAQEEARLVLARLGPKLRVRLLLIVDSIGLGVEVAHVGVLPPGEPGDVGHRRDDEALQARNLGSGVDDVLELARLAPFGPIVQLLAGIGLEFVLGGVWVAVDGPEVSDGEDGVGILESCSERARLVDVSLNDLDATRREGGGAGAGWIAGDAADAPVGLPEEGVDNGAALVSGGTDNDDELWGRHVGGCNEVLGMIDDAEVWLIAGRPPRGAQRDEQGLL